MVLYIEKLIHSLPSPSSFVFHSEVFIDQQRNITLCEIACRPPGGGMIKAINHIFDIDLFKIAILSQINSKLINKEELKYKSKNYTKLFASVFVHPSKGELKYIKPECELNFVSSYNYFVEIGKTYNNTGGDSCEGAAIFIVSANTENELRNNVESSVKWFRNSTIWT